jgi:hypothetical protein
LRRPFLILRAHEEDVERGAPSSEQRIGLLAVWLSYGRGVIPLFCKLSEPLAYAAVLASFSGLLRNPLALGVTDAYFVVALIFPLLMRLLWFPWLRQQGLLLLLCEGLPQ